MRSPFLNLLLIMFFLCFPMLLFCYDQFFAVNLEQETRLEALRQRAIARLQELNCSTDPIPQMELVLGATVAEIASACQDGNLPLLGKRIGTAYLRNIKSNFPANDFLACMIGGRNVRKVLFERSESRTNELSALFSFSRLAAGETLELGEPPRLSTHLGEALHFPTTPESLDQCLASWKGKVISFPSDQGCRGLFWWSCPIPETNLTLVVSTLISLSNLPPDWGYRNLTDRFRDNDSGIGFLPVKAGKPILSNFFERFPTISRDLYKMAARKSPPQREERFGKVLLFKGSPHQGSPFIPVVAFEHRGLQGISPFRFACLVDLAGIWFVIALFIAVEKVVFRRGPKFQVGSVIQAAFLFVALLPITLANTLNRGLHFEQEKISRLDAARNLHEKLVKLDQGAAESQVELLQQFKTVCGNQSVVSSLDKDRGKGGNTALQSLAREVARYRSIEEKADEPLVPNAVTVMGPDSFTRIFYPRLIEPVSDAVSAEFLKVVSFLHRPLLEEIDANWKILRDTTTARLELPKGFSREGFLVETMIESLVGVGGPDLFLDLLHFPGRVGSMKSSYDRSSLIQIPIFSHGRLKYLVMWIWSEVMVDLPYLFRQLVIEERKKGSGEIFAILRPGKITGKSVPWDRSPPEILQQMVARADSAGLTVRAYEGDRQRVLEAFPARNLANYVLAGAVSTQGVFEELRRSRRNFNLVLVGFLFVAFLTGIWGAMHILDPLRDLFGAAKAVEAENYDVQLDDSRPDEFGKLGAAFNRMTRRLQEMVLLKKYVSSSVHEAVKSPTDGDLIAGGKVRDVTVLFSSLSFFDEFQQNHTPEEVFREMEIHLGAVNSAVQAEGGEIDKVIGEKILLVFTHERFGAPEKAVRAALMVAKKVRKALEGRPLPPAMGITSGPVVAGILGSVRFRMDLTVIGDTVNLGARLAAIAQSVGGTRVVVSSEVLSMAGESVCFRRLPMKRVKGKTHEVEASLLIE